MNRVLVEVCLDSAESARAAEAGGARRVELCDNLVEGGTTPSAGMIAITRRSIEIDLQVIIRPRGGDFLYSQLEFDAMMHDVVTARELGANGVVIGQLNADGTVDRERTARLIEAAGPMSVTFHRAFDMARDPYEAMETLIDLGIRRILTSGQEPTVLEGLELITALVKAAGDRIIIMPGCGVTPRNFRRIVDASQVSEIHVVGNCWLESAMAYRNPVVYMGTELRSPEYTRPMTDAGIIRSMTSQADRG